MENIQHANAKTTPKVRKEIQESKESITELAKRVSLSPKTVTKYSMKDVLQIRKVVQVFQSQQYASDM